MERLLAGRPAWLLIPDQMEELFAREAEPYRDDFIAFLLRAVAEPRLRLVATIRSDFLHYLNDHPELCEILNREPPYFVQPPGPQALARLIEEPLRSAGLTCDPTLTDRLVRDAHGQSGGLALLGAALEDLYNVGAATGGCSFPRSAWERLRPRSAKPDWNAPRPFPLHSPRRATGGAPRKQTVPCAAAPGTTIQPTRARPTATGTIRITEIPRWVFGWCVGATSPRVIFKPLRSLPWRKKDSVSYLQPARPVRSLVGLRRSTGPSVPPRPADQGLRDAVELGGMARVRPVRAAQSRRAKFKTSRLLDRQPPVSGRLTRP